MGYKSYILPAILALLLHVIVLGVLSVHWQGEPEHIKQPRHIQAQMIDLSALRAKQQAEERAQAQAAAERKAQAQAQQRQAQQRARAERERKAKAEAQRKERAEAKRQQAIRQKELAAKKAREARLAERKEAERQKALAAKRKEAQEKAAEAAAEKRRQAAEQKRIAEAKAQQERMDQLAALMEADAQQAAQAAQAAADAETRATIADYIQSVLMTNWRLPATARKGMLVVVNIRLLPNGQVDAVAVKQSSGNSALDRSAEQAVWRVDKFPRVAELAREEPLFFERNLRRITINFRPENSRW